MDPNIASNNRTQQLSARLCAASIPLVAVLIGLYLFSNAWLAAGLYYAGALAWIITTGQIKIFKSLTEGLTAKLSALIVGVFALAGAVTYFLLPPAIRPDANLNDFLSSVGLDQWRYVLFAVLFCPLNPAIEEAFWRGTLPAHPNKPSWTDAAFAIYHIPVVMLLVNIPLTVLSFVILALTSWLLRYLKEITNGLATPCLAHLTADIAIMASVYLLLHS